jgi:hypothetical protein
MQSVVRTARFAGWSVAEALAQPYDELIHLSCIEQAEAMADDLYNREYSTYLKNRK